VLNAKNHVSKILTAGQSTVALRVPNHPIALQLLEQSGLALAAPSANKYTQLSPTTAAHVEAGLGNNIPVLEGGASKVGIESTIVHLFEDAQKNWQWQLLRQGMVSEAAIEALAGKPTTSNIDQQALPKVPGQHALHYSPRTPLHLCLTREALIKSIEHSVLNKKTCAALMFEDDANAQSFSCTVKMVAKNPELYAEHLYASLHALDALNVEQLFVELPPNENAWLPVLDRLKRAAHSV
jgi:L-threonylcarbamoyladenylate synthase